LRKSLPKYPPKHLAVVILWQAACFENPDAARRFVTRKILPAPIQQFAFIGKRAWLQFDRRNGYLSLLLVRQAKGNSAGYCRM
jgi:hypothetical protein